MQLQNILFYGGLAFFLLLDTAIADDIKYESEFQQREEDSEAEISDNWNKSQNRQVKSYVPPPSSPPTNNRGNEDGETPLANGSSQFSNIFDEMMRNFEKTMKQYNGNQQSELDDTIERQKADNERLARQKEDDEERRNRHSLARQKYFEKMKELKKQEAENELVTIRSQREAMRRKMEKDNKPHEMFLEDLRNKRQEEGGKNNAPGFRKELRLNSERKQEVNVTIAVLGRSGSGVSSTIRELIGPKSNCSRSEGNATPNSIMEYLIEIPSTDGNINKLRLLGIPGFTDGHTIIEDSKILASLKSIVQSTEIPDFYLVLSRFDDTRLSERNSNFVKFLKRLDLFHEVFLKNSLVNPAASKTVSSILFLLTRFMSDTKAVKQNPEQKIEEIKTIIENSTRFPRPINIVVGDNKAVIDHGVQIENGYYKLPNNQLYPKNIWQAFINVSSEDTKAKLLTETMNNRESERKCEVRLLSATWEGYHDDARSFLFLLMQNNITVNMTEINNAIDYMFDSFDQSNQLKYAVQKHALQLRLQQEKITDIFTYVQLSRYITDPHKTTAKRAELAKTYPLLTTKALAMFLRDFKIFKFLQGSEQTLIEYGKNKGSLTNRSSDLTANNNGIGELTIPGCPSEVSKMYDEMMRNFENSMKQFDGNQQSELDDIDRQKLEDERLAKQREEDEERRKRQSLIRQQYFEKMKELQKQKAENELAAIRRKREQMQRKMEEEKKQHKMFTGETTGRRDLENVRQIWSRLLRANNTTITRNS